MTEFLLENAALVVVIGGILAILWRLLDLRKLFTEHRDAKRDAEKDAREQAKEEKEAGIKAIATLNAYTEEAKALAKRVDDTPGTWDVWSGTRPPEDVPEAVGLMRENYSLYHRIFLDHQLGNYPASTWLGVLEEIEVFLSLDFVRANLDYANSLDPEFGAFMRTHAKEK